MLGVAAAAVPVIALSTAAPAFAASPTDLGVLAFASAPGAFGIGYATTLTVVLVPAAGQDIPSSLTFAYSTPGVLDGPTSAPTNGSTSVIINITGSGQGSTSITVSAPGYTPATVDAEVGVPRDYEWYVGLDSNGSGSSWGPQTRYVDEDGVSVDTVSGVLGRTSAQWLGFGGSLTLGASASMWGNATMNISGGNGLRWDTESNFTYPSELYKNRPLADGEFFTWGPMTTGQKVVPTLAVSHITSGIINANAVISFRYTRQPLLRFDVHINY